MSESFDQSVTMWIRDLKQGDDNAASKLWERYFQRLQKLAARKLGNAARRIADEEDVAIGVMDALYRGAAEGRFAQLENRDDLWSLLVAITGKKAVDQVRRQTSQKRGGTSLRGESVFFQKDANDLGMEQVLADEPTPEFLHLMDEQNQRLMDLLQDDTLKEIARRRMAGYSNEEIAEATGISLRSVVRKLGVIREVWAEELELRS